MLQEPASLDCACQQEGHKSPGHDTEHTKDDSVTLMELAVADADIIGTLLRFGNMH